MRPYMPEREKLNLLSIMDAINKIEKYSIDKSSADKLYKDEIAFDAVLMNFIVIGEMVLRLSDEFIDQHSDIDWFKIKGFRNVIAHDYFGVDAEEVWQIITEHLPLLKNKIQNILNT